MTRSAVLRRVVGCAVLAAALQAGILPALAAEGALVKKTYTYKTVGDVQIQADVYRTSDAKVQPVVVWIHGGALLFGGRGDVPRELLNLCKSAGFTLVSLDYRLAPEVKVPAIVEDVQDALRWMRAQGPKLFAADPAKIAVAGGSAGGYLTLMTGVGPDPLPKVLVSYWGYGDVVGDWVAKPSAFFNSHMAKRPKEKVYQAVGKGVLTNTEGGNSARMQGRLQFFYHLRQNGLWTREASGLDPLTEAEKIYPYCPVRNITPKYPPTMLIHGTADNDVPVHESEAMAAELAQAQKVPHELIVVQGAGHGLGGGDKKLVAEANDRALAFIRDHLK